MTPRPLACALSALLTLTGTVRADTPPDMGAQRVPLGDGRTLTVSAPRRLTTNAHVRQFQFRWAFREVAYAGSDTSGDTMTQFVRLVNFDTRKTTTLLSVTGPAQGDTSPVGYDVAAWSRDGRYALVEHSERLAAKGRTRGTFGIAWYCLDMSVSPPSVRRAPLPDASQMNALPLGNVLSSPSGHFFSGTEGQLNIYDNPPGSLRLSMTPLPTPCGICPCLTAQRCLEWQTIRT